MQRINSLSVNEDFVNYCQGALSEYPDMTCPEAASPRCHPYPAGLPHTFWSKSCLAKTCSDAEWTRLFGKSNIVASEKDLACRHKGCSEGNRQRAAKGLPPLLPSFRAGESPDRYEGLGICKCGEPYNRTHRGYKNCPVCRLLTRFANAQSVPERNKLRKAIQTMRKQQELRKEKRDAAI